MKCVKCGNIIKTEVCNNCGEVNHHINVIEKKRDNRKEIGLILLIVSVFIYIFAIGIRNLKDYEKKDYIKINNEEIPTIAQVIGHKKIVNYKKDSFLETIMYDYSNFTYEELEEYLITLTKHDFIMYDTDIGIGLIKELDQNNNLLSIYLTVESGNLKITYKQIKDSLINYNLEGNIKIGNNILGFMSIPATFSKLEIKDKYIEYVNVNNNKERVSIEINEDKKTLTEYTQQLMKLYEKNGAISIKNSITIYGYKAALIESNFEKENLYLRTYAYIKEDSTINKITIESNNQDSELFSSISSYEVVK